MPPQISSPGEMAMSGLVFRENKFSAEPLLPFGSLAMPAFDRLQPEEAYIDIEGNQFPCRSDWQLGGFWGVFLVQWPFTLVNEMLDFLLEKDNSSSAALQAAQIYLLFCEEISEPGKYNDFNCSAFCQVLKSGD